MPPSFAGLRPAAVPAGSPLPMLPMLLACELGTEVGKSGVVAPAEATLLGTDVGEGAVTGASNVSCFGHATMAIPNEPRTASESAGTGRIMGLRYHTPLDIAGRIGEGLRMRLFVCTAILAASFLQQERSATAQTAASPGAPSAVQDRQEHMVSLQEALTRFENDNLDLLAAKHEVAVSRASVVATGVWPNPSLGLGGAILAHGGQTGGEQEFSVSVGQPIPFAGQIGTRQAVAEAYASAAEAEFAATFWQLATEVKLAYLELQLREQEVLFEENALKEISQIEQIIDVRAQAGANPAYDKLRVGVERARSLSRVGEASAKVAEAKVALADRMGKNAKALGLKTSGAALADPGLLVEGVEALVARALAQRPERAALRARTQAADSAVTALRRNVIPVPTLSVGYNHARGILDGTERRSGGMVFAQLSLPLPLLDRGQGAVDRSLAFVDAENARRENVEVAIRRDVERAYEVDHARFSAWSKFKDAAGFERMRQIAELSYKEGRATVLELLDAYGAHRDLKLQSLTLRAAALRARIELERAVGPASPRRP
jgi:outer membrane protein, heavy metal efflux system